MRVDGFLRTFFDRFVPVGGYAEATVRPWNFAVAEGSVSGAVPLSLIGFSDTNNTVPMWDLTTAYVWQTADQQPWLVSSSANDDGAPLGSGAQTVKVTWLDSAGVEATEVVTMNGVANVQMAAATVRRINRVEVVTAGATGYNEGNITVYATDAATPMAYMRLGRSVAWNAIQTVPAGKRDILTYLTMGAANVSVSCITGLHVIARTSTAEAFRIVGGMYGRTCIQSDWPYPVVLEAGTDYYLQLENSSGSDSRVNVAGWREAA